MITRTTRLDLRRDSREADRRAVTMLYAVPAGTRVILDVGSRHHVTGEIAHYFRDYAMTLHLEVQGEPGAVSAWLDALLGRGIWEAA